MISYEGCDIKKKIIIKNSLNSFDVNNDKACPVTADASLFSSPRPPYTRLRSASLTPDAARLWDRWFKHALLLKERSVLSEEHLVQLFTPLLLERHATYGHQVASEAHIQTGRGWWGPKKKRSTNQGIKR